MINLKQKVNDLIDDLKYFFNKLKYNIICFPKKLKRAISWFIFMFNNEEWDFEYFYDFLIKRLVELEKFFKTKSTNAEKEKIVNEIKTIICCLNKLKESIFDLPIYEKFESKYGNYTIQQKTVEPMFVVLELKFSKCKTIEQEKHAEKLLYRLFRLEQFLKNKYRKKAFRLLEKSIESWWD